MAKIIVLGFCPELNSLCDQRAEGTPPGLLTCADLMGKPHALKGKEAAFSASTCY